MPSKFRLAALLDFGLHLGDRLAKLLQVVRENRNRAAEFLPVFHPGFGDTQILVAVLRRFHVEKVSFTFGFKVLRIQRIGLGLF